MNLTGGSTVPLALINLEILFFNLKISRDTKRRIHKIAIINGRNTLVVYILMKERYGKFICKVNLLDRLLKNIEISQ